MSKSPRVNVWEKNRALLMLTRPLELRQLATGGWLSARRETQTGGLQDAGVAREWGRIPASRDNGGQIVRLDGADDRQWIRCGCSRDGVGWGGTDKLTEISMASP
jgi:hypothetical protein